MKKHFTILASAVLLATTSIPSAIAAGSYAAPVADSPVSALQLKEVNSKLIQQLELNENQYIQLKALYNQYKKEVAQLTDTPKKNIQIEGLNNSFYTEAAKILSSKQLESYIEASRYEATLAESK